MCKDQERGIELTVTAGGEEGGRVNGTGVNQGASNRFDGAHHLYLIRSLRAASARDTSPMDRGLSFSLRKTR